jgi:serine protease
MQHHESGNTDGKPMKRIFSSLLLATCFLSTPLLTTAIVASAVKTPNDLSYKFYNQRIALITKPNQVAVVFKPVSNTSRGASRGASNDEPNYIKLQQVLAGETSSTSRGTSRGASSSSDLKIDVKPLGTQYAILTLPKGTRSIQAQQELKSRLDLAYVKTTLPIFQRKNITKGGEETIVLNNEMIIGFEPGTSESQVKEILERNDAEIIRPLRFTKNQYLVRSRHVTGTELLPVIDQLSTIAGVKSASPNFIQSINDQPDRSSIAETKPETNEAPQALASLPKLPNSPYPDSLISQQWHLNSSFKKGTGSRTDIHAIEAWKNGNQGQGTVVAVIDSVIQWDHPDLQGSLYKVPQNLPDLLPGEVHGWNFSDGESETCTKDSPNNCVTGNPDTRLSQEEINDIKPHFQRMFQSDEVLLKAYPKAVNAIREDAPKLSDAKVAGIIRRDVLHKISGAFHGTWVSGVIAAKPQEVGGAVGVAPNTKILPVRAMGLGGSASVDRIIESIGYAAARKVDVINLSLGSLVPTQSEADQIFSVLDEDKKLVIVASSGNENIDGSGYPAAIPGVISVGSSNLEGNRSVYSNYGRRLSVMAPRGDTSLRKSGGILTTGGTFIPSLWEGITVPKINWGPTFDPMGKYVQVQGTSFSSPTVAGVVALMKAADPDRQLTRDEIIKTLEGTASYQPLNLTQKDKNHYRLQKDVPATIAPNGMPVSLPGNIQPIGVIPIEQYYFGKGLVNAEAAVNAVKQQVNPGK